MSLVVFGSFTSFCNCVIRESRVQRIKMGKSGGETKEMHIECSPLQVNTNPSLKVNGYKPVIGPRRAPQGGYRRLGRARIPQRTMVRWTCTSTRSTKSRLGMGRLPHGLCCSRGVLWWTSASARRRSFQDLRLGWSLGGEGVVLRPCLAGVRRHNNGYKLVCSSLRSSFAKPPRGYLMRFIFCFFGLCLATQDDGSIHTQRSLALDFRFFDIKPPTYSITLMFYQYHFSDSKFSKFGILKISFFTFSILLTCLD